MDNRLMGIFCAYPFMGRFGNHLFNLMVIRSLAPLDQHAGVGFILQDAEDCGG